MIKLSNIFKTYAAQSGAVEALRGIDLSVAEREIHGIIGYSGAGKSTLVRCINLLERPTSGTVEVGGVDLTALSPKELREKRREIGMIFQQFNLFSSRTVEQNVAFPLKNTPLTKAQKAERVAQMLELVGLSDKARAYPSQLSGGQKQRVAIARALASRPKILLCDEATSALDPRTTLSILQLLRRLNERLGLTIVVVTHEMNVVKEICSRVSVMENGLVCESGPVFNVFARPQTAVAQGFVDSQTRFGKVLDLIERGAATAKPDERWLKIKYVGDSADRPLVSQISRQFNVDVNIVFGNLEIIAGASAPIGTLAAILSGENIDAAIQYLRQNGAQVEVISSGHLEQNRAQCGR